MEWNAGYRQPYKAPIDRTGYPARVTVYPKPPGHVAKPAYKPLPGNETFIGDKPEVDKEAFVKEPHDLRRNNMSLNSVHPTRPIISGADPYSPSASAGTYRAEPDGAGDVTGSHATKGTGSLPPYPGLYVTSGYPSVPSVTPPHPYANNAPITKQFPPSKVKADDTNAVNNTGGVQAEVIPHVQARMPPNSPYWVDVPDTGYTPEDDTHAQNNDTDPATTQIRGQSYMGLAVVVTVCFNCPIGLLAIMTSLSALRDFEAGNRKRGKSKATWSLMLSMLGMILTVAIMMTLVYHMAYTDAFADYGY